MPVRRLVTICWRDVEGRGAAWTKKTAGILSEFHDFKTENVAGNLWETVFAYDRKPSVTDKQLAESVIEAWQNNFSTFEICSVTISSKQGAELIMVDEDGALKL